MKSLPSRIEHHSRRLLGDPDPARQRLAALVALTYELLDAHADTARLAEEEASNADWQNHLAYLRDLQRVGREALARAIVEGERPPACER